MLVSSRQRSAPGKWDKGPEPQRSLCSLTSTLMVLDCIRGPQPWTSKPSTPPPCSPFYCVYFIATTEWPTSTFTPKGERSQVVSLTVPPLTCAPCCFHSIRIPASPAPGPPASAMLSPSLWLVPCRPPSAARVAVLQQQRHPVSFLTPCSTGSLLRAHILDLLHTGSCNVWRLARLWHTSLGHAHPEPLFLYNLHLFEVSTPFSTASLVSTVHL